MSTQKSSENQLKTPMDDDDTYSRRRFVQNFLLIWINANIDDSTDEYQNILAQLRSVVNDVHVFKKQDEAIDFLTEVNEMKAFLIVDDTISQQIVSLIHDIPQLDSILIFSQKQTQHESWTKKWVKINGLCTDITSLREALHQTVRQCDQDSIPVSFVTVNKGALSQDLNQLDPSFMYTQIFKQILLEMKHDEKSAEDLASYCYGFYLDNERELMIINEFEQNYRSKSPIWWYTRECFTYHMLNRALRTLECDTIIHMGFFISDLHRQLQQLHQEQIGSHHGKPFMVYRGQGLSSADFEKLQNTKRGLMSFNSFLSTSKNRNVSLRFTEKALKKNDMVGIIFEMSIDPSLSSTPFACINEVSYYKKEEEILFSMHAVFRVDEITKIHNDKSLYQVNLTLTTDDDQELRILTNHIKEEEFAGETGWKRLGQLLMKLSQLEKAEELCNVVLKQTLDEKGKAIWYNNLAYIKNHQGDHKMAIQYHENALEIFEKTRPPNHPSLAISYNNIGGVYQNMGEYLKTLSFYKKALEILQKTLPANHPSLAISYNNISVVYESMGEYSKALSFRENALKIQRKTLPPNHPSLAISYNNIAELCQKMGEYSKALSFHEKALEIFEKTLPSNHPDLATSYNNIGLLYYNMGEYSKALSFYEKAVEIRQKILPPNHPSLATSYNNIGLVYEKMGEHSKALSLHEKAVEIGQKTLPPNHPDLAGSYNNIGSVYQNIGEYSKALSFCKKAVEILQKTLPPNHPSLATSYNNIGGVYEKMGEYSKALSFCEPALEILQNALPANHPLIQTVRANLNTLKKNV